MRKRFSFVVGVITVAIAIAMSGHTRPAVATTPGQVPAPGPTYVGSGTCADCHFPIYERWAKTRMANVVTDPRIRPQVVLPDFSKADPRVTFKLDDVALVYGSKWKQRYFKKVGNDLLPAGGAMGRQS